MRKLTGKHSLSVNFNDVEFQRTAGNSTFKLARAEECLQPLYFSRPTRGPVLEIPAAWGTIWLDFDLLLLSRSRTRGFRMELGVGSFGI